MENNRNTRRPCVDRNRQEYDLRIIEDRTIESTTGRKPLNERDHWLSLTRDDFVEDESVTLFNILSDIEDGLPPWLAYDEPGRILEIGCGYGRLTERIAQMYPKCEVLGVDINKKLFPKGGAAKYRRCDSLLDLRGYSFDAIYSVTVFQHLTFEQQMVYIHESYMMLKKDGVLRVQFIDDDVDGFLDHHASVSQMEFWMRSAGFTSIRFDQGSVHPQWIWMTGVK